MLPDIFYKLPEDVLNYIYEFYWKTQYKKCMIEFKNVKLCITEVLRLHKKSCYRFSSEDVNNITQLNDKLKNVISNKGTFLFAKKIDRHFKYLTKTHNIFSNKNIGLLYQYFCSKSGLMRFYLLEDYNYFVSKLIH